MKKIIKILIPIIILLLVVLIIFIKQSNKTMIKNEGNEISQNDNFNEETIISDKEQIENLIRNMYKWTTTESIGISGFTPRLDEDEIYAIGLDFNFLEERIKIYKESGYFSEKFIENYRELWVMLDNEIKSGGVIWDDSDDIPYHSINSNLWTLSQDYPYEFWINIDFKFTELSEENASLEWDWGDKSFSKDPKNYQIELDKINGEWKVSFIEGFERQEKAIRSAVEFYKD